jgi:hypothetical protein
MKILLDRVVLVGVAILSFYNLMHSSTLDAMYAIKSSIPSNDSAPAVVVVPNAIEGPGNVLSRQEATCNQSFGLLWDKLCSGSFLQSADAVLNNDGHVDMVQIGAHVGFEANDPLAQGISYYLNMLSDSERQRFHWTFVEPSPPNYARLEQTIANHSYMCDMSTVNAGIVPDLVGKSNDSLTFYSVRETIDPETGYDSLSGKTFPVWITQISSFSMNPLNFNGGVWRRMGLSMKDYIVQTNVTAKGYSELMQDVAVKSNEKGNGRLRVVLIDTEGFDCDIILGISPDSPYLPDFLVYEYKQCKREKKKNTVTYLKALGYAVTRLDGDNNLAIRRKRL